MTMSTIAETVREHREETDPIWPQESLRGRSVASNGGDKTLSRLAAWETTLHRSWEATRILAPLVVGLAESQPGGMIKVLLDDSETKYSRAARGSTKNLLGCRGQWLGGSGEHTGKG